MTVFAALLSLVAPIIQTPSEILLALNKGEDSVSLIDSSNGNEIKRVKTGHGPNEVMVSPRGTFATISNMGNQQPDKTITVLRMPSGEVERTIDLGEYARPHGMAWLDDERVVVTTHVPDGIHIVNAKSGKVEASKASPARGIHMVVLSPDKKTAYTACATDNKMVAFGLPSLDVKHTVDCGPRAEGLSISADGKTVAVGNVGDDTVSVIDTGTMKVVKTLSGSPATIRTFFTPDGKHLAASSAGAKKLVVWQTSDWTQVKSLDLPSLSLDKLGAAEGRMPMNFAHSADGKSFYVVLVGSNRVMKVRTSDWSIVDGYTTGQTPDGIAVWSNTMSSRR